MFIYINVEISRKYIVPDYIIMSPNLDFAMWGRLIKKLVGIVDGRLAEES